MTTDRPTGPIEVLVIPDVGRYRWWWALNTLEFYPKGWRHPITDWSLSDKKNTLNGARELAARQAQMMLKTRCR